MLNRIHHLNLLVRDLDAAVERYRAALGVDSFEYGDLEQRGVRTARFRAGESWIVLVQPTDPDGEPGKHLAAHGEGLFLLSFGVDDLAPARAAVEAGGGQLLNQAPRTGLAGWQLLDLDPQQFFGATLQLTEDPADSV